MRSAEIRRKTNETDIWLWLDLDGDERIKPSGADTSASETRTAEHAEANGAQGKEKQIQTGIGFLDHMMELFARHSGISLQLSCAGDTWVDGHHSTEDIGIALGQAVKEALSDKRGICRYASLCLPMDETLILCAIDISGRGACYPELHFPTEKIGTFDTELVEEFLRAFAVNAGITLHVRQLAGSNSHHIAEGCFKALGRVLGKAVSYSGDARFQNQIPSTKGCL